MRYSIQTVNVKKLIVGRKWKKYLAARSRSQLKANARFAAHRHERSAERFQHSRPHHFRKEAGLDGPEVFSLIQNPEGTIAFLHELQEVTHKRNAFVDLSAVQTMTPDAIAALVAMLANCTAGGARVHGNVPAEKKAEQMLNDSGFRRYVRTLGSGDLMPAKGQIIKRVRTGEAFQNRFDQRLARDLVAFATSKLTGQARPHGPSFSILCEAMLNTLNHAARSTDRERWWASAYFDSETGRACFTFIDQGVGIFESHQLTMKLRVLAALRFLNRGELLQRIFQGQIPSTTREPGRGNGIPGMYDHCKAGRIRNFTVISNNVFGNAETETYRVLSRPFEGTLLYWEIEP